VPSSIFLAGVPITRSVDTFRFALQTSMQGTPSNVQPLLDDLRVRLQDLYGDRLADVILFGSVARGDATEESDVDVLVVLHGPVDRHVENKRLSAIVIDLMEEYGWVVTPIVASAAALQSEQWPLYRSIHSEGRSVLS
jgi:predicted nucleotidyltransferase